MENRSDEMRQEFRRIIFIGLKCFILKKKAF